MHNNSLVIQKAQSIGDFGFISNKLKKLKDATDKKKQSSGVDKYIDNDGNDSDSDDVFDVEENVNSMMN